MADLQRLHVEILVQVATDVALQNVESELDKEQDDDLLTLFSGVRRIKLASGAAATEIPLPIGAASIKFIAVTDVDSSDGINLHFGGGASTAVLVKKPSATGKYGHFVGWVEASSLHVSNPSGSAGVNAKILLGCSE